MKKIFAILASAKSGISLTKMGFLVLFLPIIKTAFIHLSFGEGWGEAFAQIVIEERVEVLPQSNNYLSDDPTQSHTITAIVEWDTTGGTQNFLRARMNMINECTADTILSDYVYDGHIELSMSSTDAVRYEINTFTEAKDPPPNQSWSPFIFGHSLKVYSDGVLIYENPTFHTSGSNTSIFYWRSNLEVRIASYSWNRYDNALCFGERARTYLTDEEDCQPALWNASQDIQVTILEGGEHTSFYYGGSELLGDNVTFSTDVHGNYFSSYGDIELKYDIEYTDTTTDKLVVLEAIVNGFTARDTIIIPKTTGYTINGETEGETARIISGDSLMINFWLEKGGMCEGIASPPEGTTFEAEIIQGAEFGGLVDTATGQTALLLTGLTAEGEQVSIQYIADGNEPQADEEIIVMISSSLAGVEPFYVSFLVGLSELYVDIEPDTLHPGETAVLILKHRLEDGTLEDFPPEQTFEVGMLEGCTLGNIIAGTDTSQYLYEVTQPVTFIADSSAEANGVVKLIVGLIEDIIIIGKPVGVVENETEQFVELENKKNPKTVSENEITEAERNEEGSGITSDNPTEYFCFTEPLQTTTTQQVEVVVGGGCDDWACESNFNRYDGTIGIKDEMANYNEYNLCRFWNITEGVGGFFPLFDKAEWYLGNGQFTEIKDQLRFPFQLEACYKTDDSYWQFSVIEDSISLRAIIDVCDSNIGYEHIIHNLQELSIIPNENTCLALEDFEK